MWCRSESSEEASSSAQEQEELQAGPSPSSAKAENGSAESEAEEERRLVRVNVECSPPSLPYPPEGEMQVRGEHSAVWQCVEYCACDCNTPEHEHSSAVD